MRLPRARDGLEVALQFLLRGQGGLGDPIETGFPGLTHLSPRANQVTGAGVPKRRSETVAKLGRAVLATLIVMWAPYCPDALYTKDWARHLIAGRGPTALDLGEVR